MSETDGVIGIGIAATAVGVLVGGIAAALARKGWTCHINTTSVHIELNSSLSVISSEKHMNSYLWVQKFWYFSFELVEENNGMYNWIKILDFIF